MKRLITAAILSLASLAVQAQDLTIPQETEQGVFKCSVDKYEMLGDNPVLNTTIQGTIAVAQDGSLSYRISIFDAQNVEIVGSIDNPNMAVRSKPGFGIRKILRKRLANGSLDYFFFTERSDNVYHVQMAKCNKLK